MYVNVDTHTHLFTHHMHISTRKILNKTAGLGKDKTNHKSVLNGKLCLNTALLYCFNEHIVKVSLEITTLDTDILRPMMHTAFPKLCVSI